MKRGDIVVVVASGDYGKPRPAVVIQSDIFNETHASILVCLITSDLQNTPLFRIMLYPTEENGLKLPSQIMVDKLFTVRRDRIGNVMGRMDDATMLQLGRLLALFIGL